MKLVLDNNILFSLMSPRSSASYLFSMIRSDFFAPDSIKSEFTEHKGKCLLYSKLSGHEFDIRQAEMEKGIKFFGISLYGDFLAKSLNALPDPDDAEVLALALRLKSQIWSNDPHLKQQSLAEVFTTKELIDKLLDGDL